MSPESFYADLPSLGDFLDITDVRKFVSVPSDWQIIVTDITNSTQAISSGLYKEVNFIGAASIVAILNIAKNIDIPFVFGGDGASILIPPSLVAAAETALLVTQNLAKTQFDLHLRVGRVPVLTIEQQQYEVKIAKLKISENYQQAIFTGCGLTYATELVKNPATTNIYQINSKLVNENADFSGLECRWQTIPSKQGEIVTLLVMATGNSAEEASWIYKQVLEQIKAIYGEDRELHPIAAENLQLTLNENELLPETKWRSKSDSWLERQLYLSTIKMGNYLGKFLMGLKVKTKDVDWGNYKENTIANTDYKKFDDILRMVIGGNALQRKKLNNYLDSQYESGKLVYGLHKSDRAIMTCLVFERNGRQVHFVDGADGGYALAAKAMKERINQRSTG